MVQHRARRARRAEGKADVNFCNATLQAGTSIRSLPNLKLPGPHEFSGLKAFLTLMKNGNGHIEFTAEEVLNLIGNFEPYIEDLKAARAALKSVCDEDFRHDDCSIRIHDEATRTLAAQKVPLE